MRTKFLYLFAVSATLAFAFSGCSKSDDNNENVFKQSYNIRLGTVNPYGSRYYAGDSLVTFITDNMGLEKDNVPNKWLIAGENTEACDKEILSRFEKACSLVDPDEYGGQYSVSVFRTDGDGSKVTIADKEFMSTAENDFDLFFGFSGSVVPQSTLDQYKDYYIYDLAISADDNSGDAFKHLVDSGYIPLKQDFAIHTYGKYIYVGYKGGTADFVTNYETTVTDDLTGKDDKRKRTAKEMAISYVVALQEEHCPHPLQFMGPKDDRYSDFVFERFHQLGLSNGDTNQGTTKYMDCYLYFSRTHNDTYGHLYYMYAYSMDEYIQDICFGQLSKKYMVCDTKYVEDTQRCYSWENPCDFNNGTTSDYVYLNVFTAYPNNNDK